MLRIFLALLAVRAAAEPSLLRSRPAFALVDEVVELRPADAHHFNVEAPQKCGDDAPIEVLPRRLRCQMTRPETTTILVSVCDDALTYCRQESFAVNVAGAAKAAAKASPLAASPRADKRAPEGFLDNDPARALADARRENRLILIDFYGVWCPPCNQLEEEAYPAAVFKAAAADYVKIGLDADAAVSYAWKARFKVGGYPTLVVADADLRELGRVVGFLSAPALAAFLDGAKALRTEPVEVAAARLAHGGAAATLARRLRVARWRAERGEFAAVEALLAGRAESDARRELLLARRERARREDDTAARVAAAKDLAAGFPLDAEFVYWAAEIAESDKAAGLNLRAAVRESVRKWSSNPAVGETGFTPGDLESAEAGFVEIVASTQEARPLWSAAADAYAREARLSPLKAPRAANFGLGDALLKAGRTAEAKALYEALVRAYPREFTFNYEYASELSDGGDATGAYPYAVAAERAAYGDNWLRAVRLKGELELILGRPADAAKTVDEALAQAVLPKSAAVRTYRYVAALRDLRRRIAAAKS